MVISCQKVLLLHSLERDMAVLLGYITYINHKVSVGMATGVVAAL